MNLLELKEPEIKGEYFIGVDSFFEDGHENVVACVVYKDYNNDIEIVQMIRLKISVLSDKEKKYKQFLDLISKHYNDAIISEETNSILS